LIDIFIYKNWGRIPSRATRNIPRVTCLPPAGLNVYDLLRHELVVFSEPAIADIEARLSSLRD
jgi:ribosomal protein L4